MGAETFLDGRVTLHVGDCLDVLAAMPENSVDSVVCDPPYHLTSIVKRFGAEGAAPAKAKESGAFQRASAGFMGKAWDGGDIAFRVETWAAVLRVLKPGGYILAFASTRGFGRMSVAIEDAGFITHPIFEFLCEQPDVAAFFDSLDHGQRAAFARLLVNAEFGGILAWIFGSGFPKATRIKAEGFDGQRYGGQALKPALEPIYMGQKPFSEDTGTANILRWGTGAVNIDACRVKTDEALGGGAYSISGGRRPLDGDDRDGAALGMFQPGKTVGASFVQPTGRWPANLIHDGSEAVVAAFPDTKSGEFLPHHQARGASNIGTFDIRDRTGEAHPTYGDQGSAARFFYAAKADADDRIGSRHPTVKPLDLIQYLCRLITPKGGTVLDLFAGTGTTGEAAWREGFNAILIEREAEYADDIRRRMKLAMAGPEERKRAMAAIAADRAGTPADHGPLFGECA